jgi:hypothetical protein
VSKKTIAFAMPAAGPHPRERAPMVLDGLTGESVSFADNEQNLRDAGGQMSSDDWVRERPRDPQSSWIPERASRGLAVGASLTIDVAAERNLAEAMTLTFMLPFALGWFWFAHAIARRQRLWGA